MADSKVSLTELVIGPNLLETESRTELVLFELDRQLTALIDLLPKIYGETVETRHAQEEVQRIIEMEKNDNGVICRRAMYLFALFTEEELCQYWTTRDDDSHNVALDLKYRVLPFVMPRFIKGSCQNPMALLIITNILHVMWRGEVLGNFGPFTTSCPV
jgi:pyruvate-formate lyase